jgi:hypothetical protein
MTQTPVRRSFAFALLAAQLLGSGVVSLAHARERFDAPRHIESVQHEQCLVVHDAATCVLCAFAHTRAPAPAAPEGAVAPPPEPHPTAPVIARLRPLSLPHSGEARAPPPSQG